MRYLTIVYNIPDDFDVKDLCANENINAMAWSHKMDDYNNQKKRADVLAATIIELTGIVTHDGETKDDFIARVRSVLGANPDNRVKMK